MTPSKAISILEIKVKLLNLVIPAANLSLAEMAVKVGNSGRYQACHWLQGRPQWGFYYISSQKKKIPGMLSTKLQTLYNSLLVFTITENDLWKLILLREKQIILTNANANMFILQS